MADKVDERANNPSTRSLALAAQDEELQHFMPHPEEDREVRLEGRLPQIMDFNSGLEFDLGGAEDAPRL
ncbi:MAG: hypothetical protein HQ512_03310 [Rhodospirillales bacterium]|nr:hypothetical protein [Rhodospirillales bacterium]